MFELWRMVFKSCLQKKKLNCRIHGPKTCILTRFWRSTLTFGPGVAAMAKANCGQWCFEGSCKMSKRNSKYCRVQHRKTCILTLFWCSMPVSGPGVAAPATANCGPWCSKAVWIKNFFKKLQSRDEKPAFWCFSYAPRPLRVQGLGWQRRAIRRLWPRVFQRCLQKSYVSYEPSRCGSMKNSFTNSQISR